MSLTEGAEPGRRQSHEPAKDIGEMTLISKAGSQTHFAQTDVRIAQQLLGALEATLQDELVRAAAGAALEELGEVKRTQIADLRELLQVQIAIEICLNVFEYPS